MSDVPTATQVDENLRGLAKIRLEVEIDCGSEHSAVVPTVEREVVEAVTKLCESSGLILRVGNELPTLHIFVAIRVIPTINRSVQYGYRVETSLRENAALRFGITDAAKSFRVESWRHAATLQFVTQAAALDPRSKQALDEALRQVADFVAGWSEQNPELRRNHAGITSDISDQIDEIGPVFEARLHQVGIRSVYDLARLTDAELEFIAAEFAVPDSAGELDIAAAKTLLKRFRKQARELLDG